MVVSATGRKAAVVALLAGCVAAVVWMFHGKAAGDGVVGNSRRRRCPGGGLILGGPGAGKTTAMMLLLIEVLTRYTTEPGGAAGPVPVWLTLGSWSPRSTTLVDWAATVVNRDYPGLAAYAGSGTAAELFRAGRVALFLDGLGRGRCPTIYAGLPCNLRVPAAPADRQPPPRVAAGHRPPAATPGQRRRTDLA